MKKLILAFLSLYILSGCATTAPTTAQIQYNRLIAQVKSTEEAFKKCFAPIKSSPLYRRLEERFIMDPDDPRLLEKLTITGYATEQEIKDILEYYAMGKPCEKQVLEGMEQVHPEFRTLFAKYITEDYMDMAKVIKKELTVAETNQRSLDRANRARAETSQLGQRIMAQLNQSHQSQVAERQRAQERSEAAYRQWSYQQQLLANQRRALRNQERELNKRCIGVGNTLNCY